MDYKVISPEDPSLLPCPMLKFFIITDDATISFIIEDKFSESLLREKLTNVSVSKKDLDQIVDLVNGYYTEDEIGQTELSNVTAVAQIQRILPS